MADKALLLGINDYANVSDLRGCENDVQDVQTLLLATHGFSDQNIRRHVNGEVTKAVIQDGFRWLLDGARMDDRIVFHFSGHGSYIESNDDEAVDEILCLVDMDWGDPASYLLDDEMGMLTAGIPAGVRLTVILDSCFSGTGTRVLPRQQRPKTPLIIQADTAFRVAETNFVDCAKRLQSGDADLLKRLRSEPETLVVARFVEPNGKYDELRATHRVLKLGRSLERADLNHQLLTAASDSQTAADAYIDGDFHGAFSFFLSKAAVERGREAATQTIIDDVRRSLRDAAFSQTPQIEGPFGDEKLFGGTRGSGNNAPFPPPSFPMVPEPSLSPSSIPGTSPKADDSLDRLMRLAEKFLDLADRISQRDEIAQEPPAVAGRVATEFVVYIHGISQHRAGYSNAWWNAMRPYLSRPMTKAEVVWSDIVNPRSEQARLAVPPETSRHAELRREIEEVLARRIEANREISDPARFPGDFHSRAIAEARGNDMSIDDFVRYMLNRSVRERVLQRFDAVVRPLLDTGAMVHLISHSWGSVVAYEALRNLDLASLPGRVANLFVVGSALSIGPVRSNLFGRVQDGRRPEHVDRMINLDAAGDPLGGNLAGLFEIDEQHLGLRPVGCATYPFTNSAINPACAHRSYFVPANATVARDIFAKEILNAAP